MQFPKFLIKLSVIALALYLSFSCGYSVTGGRRAQADGPVDSLFALFAAPDTLSGADEGLLPADDAVADSLPAASPRSDTLVAGKDTVERPAGGFVRDSLRAPVADSVSLLPVTDSIPSLDTLFLSDSTRQGMLDMPAFSTARDSVIEDFTDGKKMIYYYGDVSVTYGNMELTAEYMEYDVDRQTVYAAGVADTAGVVTGKPVMKEGNKTYSMDNVLYNFDTQRARIRNAVSEEEDGILQGRNMNMLPDKSININGGRYTVCDLEHPHYYLRMTRAKVETQPKQKTVFGPAYLVLEDVPLPLVLPFGFVPRRPARASGILFPTFGEEAARGLFFKDGGFYFVLGDYFDVALTGSIYTKGSWSVSMNTRYKLRYKFNGSFSLTYSNDQTGDKGSPDFFQTKNFEFKWSHAQDSKARPGTSFRASVNFSSPSNNRYNYEGINDALQNQVSSSISYSRTWSALSLSINALHSQNSRDSSYAITLPNITLNVNKFYPFKRKNRVGKERWYEQFGLSYNTTLQNKINFKASEINDPDFWNKMQTGMTHRFTIDLPTFTLFKYINFSPGVSYGMNWYFQSSSRYYNPETDKVETVKTDLFGDFGASHTFSANMSVSTRLYGLFNFRHGKLKAVRHMVTPSLSVSYSPEMGTLVNGYRTYTYTDIHGISHTEEYNKWSGGINNPPAKGKSATLSFSIGNNLEAKVEDRKDTTGTGVKKIKLIDQLNLSGGYNFLADSMKLSNFNISANTNVLEKVAISGNMVLDPYAVNYRGQRINEFNVMHTGRLVRLTSASISASFSISGDGKGKGNDGSSSSGSSNAGTGGSGNTGNRGRGSNVNMGAEPTPYTRVYYHPVTGEYIPGGWVYYLNPEVPWAITFSYSYNYSKSYQYSNDQLIVKNNHTQTLGVTAQVRLTKDLNINVTTGFDLTKLKLTTTQLSATYDLHCFQISFSWVPMGRWTQWNFRINAKAAALADLLSYRKGASEWDN